MQSNPFRVSLNIGCTSKNKEKKFFEIVIAYKIDTHKQME